MRRRPPVSSSTAALVASVAISAALLAACGGSSNTTGGFALCGNGHLDPGEQCDDGNTSDTDACTSICLPARCGDGVVEADVEQCDGINLNDATCETLGRAGTGLTCTSTCQ